MNSKTTWLSIICIETALTLSLTVGSAVSYGRAGLVSPCQPSRSSPMMMPCESSCVIPTLPIAVSRIISTNLTVREGRASWYSTNSVVADYKVRGQPLPTNGIFPMANGKPLDDNALTCALWITNEHGRPRFPDGRLVKITHVRDGSRMTAICAWRDVGPGRVPRSRGVIIDLTPTAFKALGGKLSDGKIQVTIEEI